MLYISTGNIESCAPDKHVIKIICPSVWIHYVVSGKGYYNGRTVKAGEFFIVQKNDLCEYYPDKYDPWTYVWIRIEGNDEENLLARCNIPDKSGIFPFDYSDKLLSVAHSLIAGGVLAEANILYREAAAKIILSLNKKTDSDKPRATDERWVVRAKEYIAANYHKKITVEQVAAAIYVNRQYLRNLFVKYTGMSTKAYLNNYRMSRAAKLLCLNEVSISMVALSVGYPDPLAFSKAFKKYYGISPTEYAFSVRNN